MTDNPKSEHGGWTELGTRLTMHECCIEVFFSFYKTTIHIFCRQAEMAPEQLCWQVWANTFPFQQGSQNWRDELLFVFLIYSLGYLAPSLLTKLLNLSAKAALRQPWGCCGSAFQSLLLQEVNPKPLGVGDYVTWSSLSLSWDKVLEFRSFSTSPKAMGIHHFSSFPSWFFLLPPSHFLCSSPLSSSALF